MHLSMKLKEESSKSSSSSSSKSRQPQYSRFTQQELPACKPILTPGLIISIFVIIGIIFIPIGLASWKASENVVEIVERYDQVCVPTTTSDTDDEKANHERVNFIQDAKTDKACTRNLIVPKKMKQPIFVYYQLDNFYQNHRRYVKSRNDRQLRDPKYASDTRGCEPENVNAGKPIVPCGLVAWSLFNDTYTFSIKDSSLDVNSKDIAWGSDRKHKFGSSVFPKNFQNGSMIGGGKLSPDLPLSEQENLLVWMRTAALPNFRKLYGRIEQDLEAYDNITVSIQNNYNTYTFKGEKKLVLSTTTWIGGKNNLLGLAYFTVGSISLLIATIFSIMYLLKPRPFGDPSYLSWNKNPAEF